MACCLLAMFLLAQCMATVRRWGMFWGIVQVPEGEVMDTAYGRLKACLARPRVRLAVASVVAIELMAVGSWIYVRHGTHIAQLADIGWSRLHGQHVVYAGFCGRTGNTMVRVVLNDHTLHPDHPI